MTRATVSADGETITVHIPLTFRKRGGRKLVVTPDGRRVGAAAAGRQRDGQGAGAGVPVAEDAGHGRARDAGGSGAGEGRRTRPTSAGILRLTLLAPEIVEAILDGRQPAELQLDDAFPLEWGRQRKSLQINDPSFRAI